MCGDVEGDAVVRGSIERDGWLVDEADGEVADAITREGEVGALADPAMDPGDDARLFACGGWSTGKLKEPVKMDGTSFGADERCWIVGDGRRSLS